MEPLKDWMILEEVISGSKIAIPSTAKKDPSCTPYRVVKVGPGFYIDGGKFILSPVKPGDVVILDAPMIAKFTIMGKDYTAAMAQNVAFKLDKKDLAGPEITPSSIIRPDV